ncbi:serine protease [Solihabitans fulvus]|uniref:Serine protease n=1 Tax=Solihabitans fulvus TaxID=1892852 RepID=A0A5B2XJH6_9PSEU|nr:serine protease [Solihabitans fulvus]KAA2263997.1 serine protease [Solihabitans fulvus]
MRARSLVIGVFAAATAILGLAAPASAAGGNHPHIVGGSDADQTYSFMVSLQNASGDHFCGGSLIKPDWVVTAAHCVVNESAGNVQVRIGSTDRTQGGEVAQVSDLIPNPNYDGQGAGNDIALVHLAAPVQAAPISIAGSAQVGTQSRIIGWGQTCSQPGACGAPQTLQQLDVSVLDAGQCTGIDGSVELCTSNPGGTAGACYGDSGGPQIVQAGGGWQLIGDTSRSGNGDSTCATGPSIYTNVTAYVDWITQTTGG